MAQSKIKERKKEILPLLSSLDEDFYQMVRFTSFEWIVAYVRLGIPTFMLKIELKLEPVLSRNVLK